MSVFSNICIGLLAAGTIAMMLGLIGMEIADRRAEREAKRLEYERKNGEADVFFEIKEQAQEDGSATKQSQNEDTTQEEKVRVKIFDKVAPRKVLYSDDCKYCRYGGYGEDERLCKYSCKGCDNAEVVDGEPICHCFDMLKVESKRPQCPYFKDKIED